MGVPFGRRGTPIFIRGTVMSESERRRKYRYNRVLIESARILTPQFADSVVYLTGPQIEMLRNVTQYLNRLDTYVEEHHSGYYLTPDAADYDDILEIVADLEETLMGNPNTIWGYSGRTESIFDDTAAEGAFQKWTSGVPVGQVWVLQSCSLVNLTGARGRIELYHLSLSGAIVLASVAAPGTNAVAWSGALALKATESLYVKQTGCNAGDEMEGGAVFAQMVVPT